jgi:glycosyltransferase involved in cell wall biosynthesis
VLIGGEGDVASLVAEAHAGLVCCPGNPEALVRAIVALHSMTCEELEEMGSNGRRTACQSFGCALMIKQLSQMLGEAVTAQ